MTRLKVTLLACVPLLVAAAAIARTDAALDGSALEARWRSFAKTAAERQPARQFPYADCFRRAAAAHELPETLLLAVARGESDFKPRARSSANAYGLMQILWPGTAKHLGLNHLSDLLDPCTNVEAGARYLKELLERYLEEVTPLKKGAEPETNRLCLMMRHPVARRFVAGVRGVDIARWRDERLRKATSATVKRDLVLLGHVFEVARKKWGIFVHNPVRNIELPHGGRPRDRCL